MNSSPMSSSALSSPSSSAQSSSSASSSSTPLVVGVVALAAVVGLGATADCSSSALAASDFTCMRLRPLGEPAVVARDAAVDDRAPDDLAPRFGGVAKAAAAWLPDAGADDGREDEVVGAGASAFELEAKSTEKTC